MLIDPEACLRNLLREVLEHEGYEVVEAHNACEELQSYPPEPTELANTDVVYLVAF